MLTPPRWVGQLVRKRSRLWRCGIDADNKITIGAGATAVTLADDQSYTLSVAVTDVAGNLSSVASKTYTVDTPGLVVSESGGVISISGTATGKLMVSVNSSGTATFSRLNDSGETFTSTTTVSNFYDKQLKGQTGDSVLRQDIRGGSHGRRWKICDQRRAKPGQAQVEAYYVIVDVPEAE